MDAVTSHPGGGASEYSDQSECISSQPTTGRPRLLQCAGQHATPETQSQVDVQRNTSHCHVIANVAPGTDSLSAAPPPPPPCTNKKRLSSSESHTLIEEVAGDGSFPFDGDCSTLLCFLHLGTGSGKIDTHPFISGTPSTRTLSLWNIGTHKKMHAHADTDPDPECNIGYARHILVLICSTMFIYVF
ncbi:uncharacterized protein zgc:113363 isoform X2 [Phyllopteryx taeniolatus]|uniref:uncharacterized protein zgc:113363 isoform X2 n=1 Tax=Phyllopteryx taeniolatus TaxID=161469 RepID=UPI002AD3E0CB|nr:uncharacterized protein zgc:113363 isoform X2 [Phyllopteryx taeniolatus]